MSEIENPVETVIRLLSTKMRVVKDDGSLANVPVSREWVSQEALQNVDGQVTIGLAETVDTKLELSGKLRRRVVSLRAGVWSKDSALRFKVCEEVLRVIRENRNNPTGILYDFNGIKRASGTHKAYSAAYTSNLPPASGSWSELSDFDYQKIWSSDDVRYYRSATAMYPQMLFRFKVSKPSFVEKIILAFEGYAVWGDQSGVGFGVWNRVTQQWENFQYGYNMQDQTLTITLTSNILNYIDDNGYIYALARATVCGVLYPTTLYCDYASCMVTLKGISYLDVVSYRDLDRVDVKPPIFHTEFALKSWVFENLGV